MPLAQAPMSSGLPSPLAGFRRLRLQVGKSSSPSGALPTTTYVREVKSHVGTICRKADRSLPADGTMGKGSYARIAVADRTATIELGELRAADIALLLKRLGIPRDARDQRKPSCASYAIHRCL
jgi:hypothetical protein